MGKNIKLEGTLYTPDKLRQECYLLKKTQKRHYIYMLVDQLYMAVNFCYFVKSNFHSVQVYCSVHCTSHVLQGTRTTLLCLSGRVVKTRRTWCDFMSFKKKYLDIHICYWNQRIPIWKMAYKNSKMSPEKIHTQRRLKTGKDTFWKVPE